MHLRYYRDVYYKRDKYTHSCGNLDGVFNKRLCLVHHSCREVSNDAHLVHVALTINLTAKITCSL